MSDLYYIVVAVVAAVHFAFIGYIVIGGFLALRWQRTIWLHVPAVVWGVGFIALNVRCPLTELERWARDRAGMSPLPPKGFIAHYITGVWYPAGAAGIVQVLVFSTVCVSWAALAVTVARGWSGRNRGLVPHDSGAG